MAADKILVIRPLTSLGVSQLAVLLRGADGGEEEVLRRPGADTASVSQEIERRLEETGGVRGLLVDLESCGWVDSGVLGVWVSWYHTAHNAGRRIVICRPNERIRNILRVSQLDHLLPTHPTLEAAVAELFGVD